MSVAPRSDIVSRMGLRRGLLLALALAGLAGMVDAIGFIHLQHLFVSFMSGNSTQFAVAAGRGRFDEALPILVLIVLFVAGAAGGQLLVVYTGRWHLTAALSVIATLLTLSALLDTAPAPMVIAMGGLSAAMHRAGKIRVSLTFVTGTLVRFGEGLGNFIAGQAMDWVWAEQVLPWLGLVSGAMLAATVQMRLGSAVDWMPVAAAGLLLLLSLAIPAPE